MPRLCSGLPGALESMILSGIQPVAEHRRSVTSPARTRKLQADACDPVRAGGEQGHTNLGQPGGDPLGHGAGTPHTPVLPPGRHTPSPARAKTERISLAVLGPYQGRNQ